MWIILSDLRFQADAAMLLCVMIIINGIAPWLLVPLGAVMRRRFHTECLRG